MASSTRVLDVLNTPRTLSEGDFAREKSMMVDSDIVFNSVTFAYPERENVFSNLNLRIGGGQVTGVVGSTGSGKTTLVRMLLRFVESDEGGVEWVGVDIRNWNLNVLRSGISLVDQHITLFPTSILENIRYGMSSADDELVKNAAEIAEAVDFIEDLPQQWDT